MTAESLLQRRRDSRRGAHDCRSRGSHESGLPTFRNYDVSTDDGGPIPARGTDQKPIEIQVLLNRLEFGLRSLHEPHGAVSGAHHQRAGGTPGKSDARVEAVLAGFIQLVSQDGRHRLSQVESAPHTERRRRGRRPCLQGHGLGRPSLSRCRIAPRPSSRIPASTLARSPTTRTTCCVGRTTSRTTREMSSFVSPVTRGPKVV